MDAVSCRLTYDEAVNVLRRHGDQFQNEAKVSCSAPVFSWVLCCQFVFSESTFILF